MPQTSRRRPSVRKSVRPQRVSRETDRFFRNVVSSMRNGVLAILRDGSVAEMNAEASRIFQIKRTPNAIGRNFSTVLAKHPDMVRVLHSAFELRHLPNRAELRLKSTGKVIGYTLSHVRDERGALMGIVVFFKDLTKVEQLEERERLRDRLASLGEMAAGIAHELKNPLAGIEVMAGLLRRQVSELPDAQSLVADILSEAKLANSIVVEMLEFVRPIRLQVEQTDVAEVLHQAVTTAESKATRGKVDLKLSIDRSLPLVDGDHNQLCQVFTNLLTNAFEALDGRGHVEITAAVQLMEQDPAFATDNPAPVRMLVVEVADDGPGVQADQNDRIFDPFFTTKPQGSGLGLPIVRKIVDAHDGRIDLDSSPGRGTRFRVTLPVSSGSSWIKIGPTFKSGT